MMRVDARQKALATERNHAAWSLVVDGRTKDPQSGVFEICGPIPPECQTELLEMVDRWTREKLV